MNPKLSRTERVWLARVRQGSQVLQLRPGLGLRRIVNRGFARVFDVRSPSGKLARQIAVITAAGVVASGAL